MPRTIAMLSDLHLFSRYALLPPKIELGGKKNEKMVLEASPGQKAIWDFYLHFTKKCTEFGVDTILVDGDTIHGQNYMERGTLIVSADLDEQVDCGVQVLDLLVSPTEGPARKLYMFGGSGYHKSTKGHNPEKDICDRLGGRYMGQVANMRFTPSKRTFHIAHGESAAYIYREMLMGREMLFIKYAEATGKIPHIDAFVRGHWHQFIYIHEKGVHMIQLPCWVAFEPSKIFLKSYGKMQPDIGGCIVFIDDEDRIKVWHFTMPEIPHIADEIEEG